MNKPMFNVKVTGKIIDGFEKNSAVAALAKLVKINEEMAGNILANAPVSIKNNVDNETGQKYTRALTKIGIGCELEPVSTNQQQPVTAATPDTPDKVAQRNVQQQTATVKPQPGYSFQVEGKPDYSFLTVNIPANETLKVEASAMATMDTNIKMKTKLRGGLGRFVTGESIFMNEFTAEGEPGEIGIAPGSPGDLDHVYLNNDTIYLQNSAFVAASQGITIESKWQGLVKGFFSGESLFLIRAIGKGDVWFNTYGAIIEIDVTGDYVVDTGSIVAFTEGLTYNVSKVGGYKSLFFSGEGFVCRFSGQGKVWVQTRRVDSFVQWLYPFRPVRKSRGD